MFGGRPGLRKVGGALAHSNGWKIRFRRLELGGVLRRVWGALAHSNGWKVRFII
jgi:nitrogen fixation protein